MPPRQPPQQGIDFGLLLGTLRRRLPIILALAVLGGALGYAAQRQLKPRYTSSVSLILEPKRSDSFGADTSFGSMYVDEAKIASVVSVIEASDLLGRVVQTEHLAQVPEFGDPTPSLLRRWLALVPFVKAPAVDNSPDARFDRALLQLERSLHVDRVGFTYVLTIDASASNPELAERVASAVADAYLSDQVERKVATTQRDSAWLTDRLASVRHDLEHSEEAVDVVRRKYGLLETDLGSGATLDRQAMTELNTQLLQAQAEVANLRVRYEQVQHPGHGGLEDLPEVASSRVIEDLRAKQSEGAKQLAALKAVYGDNYPDVQRLQDGQRTLQGQIDAELSRIADGRRSEYQAAVAHEQIVQEQLQRAIVAQGGVAGDAGHERLRDAQRLVEENSGLYNALLTRWREVQQQQTREEPEARIISQASLPDKPSFPKPFMLPAGGAAAFALLGLGLTLLSVLLEKGFSSATAVEQKLGLPVLGAIPMLRRQDLRGPRRKRSIVDFASQQPLSSFAESLRMLRAFLLISADGTPTTLQITSAVPGEGKSTVAATLAVSAALAGVRTVLVDADLRASSVSAMFGVQHCEGLTDILERGVPVQSVLHERDDMALTILGGGSSPLPRPDIIGSSRLAELLRELAQSYSLVIVDGPPVLPVSDALVISRHADATVLVVQWRSTPRDVVDKAAKLLRAVSAPLVGVMLNKIDLSKVAKYERGYPDYVPATGGTAPRPRQIAAPPSSSAHSQVS